MSDGGQGPTQDAAGRISSSWEGEGEPSGREPRAAAVGRGALRRASVPQRVNL